MTGTFTPAEQFLALAFAVSLLLTAAALLLLAGCCFIAETVRRLRDEEDPS